MELSLRVVHCIHHPGGAKAFLAPVVAYLNAHGVPAVLWVDSYPHLQNLYASLGSGSRVVPCDVSTHYGTVNRAVAALRQEIRRCGANVMHAHQTRAALLPLLAAKLERVPIRIYHNHGLTYPAFRGVKRIFFVWFQRLIVSLATHVLFVSQSTLQEASRCRIAGTKPAVVPGPGSIAGIDLAEFEMDSFAPAAKHSARKIWKLEDEQFVVGYVGRAMFTKGFPQLLAAWAEVSVKVPSARLLLAGCSQADLVQFGHADLKGAVALGYLQRMREFYSACDVIVLPSLSEGFPYTLLEGGAACRALVGTDVPGIRDAIENEVTGLLVRPGDRSALVDALVRLERDPCLRSRIAMSARERVERLFDREKVLAALLQYYRQLCVDSNENSCQ